jgi:hypothetical protein
MQRGAPSLRQVSVRFSGAALISSGSWQDAYQHLEHRIIQVVCVSVGTDELRLKGRRLSRKTQVEEGSRVATPYSNNQGRPDSLNWLSLTVRTSTIHAPCWSLPTSRGSGGRSPGTAVSLVLGHPPQPGPHSARTRNQPQQANAYSSTGRLPDSFRGCRPAARCCRLP